MLTGMNKAKKGRILKLKLNLNRSAFAVLALACLCPTVLLAGPAQSTSIESNGMAKGWPKELVDRAQKRLNKGLCQKDHFGFDFSRYCQEIKYRHEKNLAVHLQQPTPARLILSEGKNQFELIWISEGRHPSISLNGRSLELGKLNSIAAIHREVLASRQMKTSGRGEILWTQVVPFAWAGVTRISAIEVLTGEILADLKTYQGCELLLNVAQTCEAKVAQIKNLSQSQQTERRKEIAQEMKAVATEFNEKIYQEIMPTDVVRGCLMQADRSDFETVASQNQKSLMACSRELDRMSDQMQSPEDRTWRQWFRKQFSASENKDAGGEDAPGGGTQ